METKQQNFGKGKVCNELYKKSSWRKVANVLYYSVTCKPRKANFTRALFSFQTITMEAQVVMDDSEKYGCYCPSFPSNSYIHSSIKQSRTMMWSARLRHHNTTSLTTVITYHAHHAHHTYPSLTALNSFAKSFINSSYMPINSFFLKGRKE